MKEKKLNPICEEKSPSDDKESVEDKEKIDQNENLCEEDENNPSTNEDLEARLNEEKEEKMPSKSTKVNDEKPKEEKDEENENSKIPTRKIIFDIKKEFKSTKKQRKSREASTFYKKNQCRKPRGKNKIFGIIKDQKVKYEKKNIPFKSPLKVKKIKKYYIPHFYVRKPSSFNSNGSPPPSEKKTSYIGESQKSSFSNKERSISQNDDDEKLTKKDVVIIRNVCSNHDKNISNFQNGQYYESIMSTNYKSN